jgi:hypothetical protein
MRTTKLATLAAALVFVGAAACSNGDDDEGAVSDADASSEGAPDSGGEEGGIGGIPAGEPIQSGRSIIATGEVSVEVDDVRAGARRVADAASAAGGFVSEQEATPSEGIATITVRIPTERFQAVLGELESLGKVLAQHIDTDDVTEQVVDLESRISSARSSVGRVRDLLDESGDVVQLAAVEGELARREADLETLLGRQRVLDDQVALATIHVDLREPAAVVEDEEEALPGFFGGLQSGWDGFLTSASLVLTGLGYALPFLVLATAGGLGWLSFRRWRERAPGPATE